MFQACQVRLNAHHAQLVVTRVITLPAKNAYRADSLTDLQPGKTGSINMDVGRVYKGMSQLQQALQNAHHAKQVDMISMLHSVITAHRDDMESKMQVL